MHSACLTFLDIQLIIEAPQIFCYSSLHKGEILHVIKFSCPSTSISALDSYTLNQQHMLSWTFFLRTKICVLSSCILFTVGSFWQFHFAKLYYLILPYNSCYFMEIIDPYRCVNIKQ